MIGHHPLARVQAAVDPIDGKIIHVLYVPLFELTNYCWHPRVKREHCVTTKHRRRTRIQACLTLLHFDRIFVELFHYHLFNLCVCYRVPLWSLLLLCDSASCRYHHLTGFQAKNERDFKDGEIFKAMWYTITVVYL